MSGISKFLIIASIAMVAVFGLAVQDSKAGCGGSCGFTQSFSTGYYSQAVIAQPIVVAPQVVAYTEQVALPQTQYFVQPQRVIQQVNAGYGYGGAQQVILQNKHGRGAVAQVNVNAGVRTRVRTVTRPVRRNVAVSSVRVGY